RKDRSAIHQRPHRPLELAQSGDRRLQTGPALFADNRHESCFGDRAQGRAVQSDPADVDAAGFDDAVEEQAHCRAKVAVAATRSAMSTSIRLTSATASVMWPWITTPPDSTRSIRATGVTGSGRAARPLLDEYRARAVVTTRLGSRRARNC